MEDQYKKQHQVWREMGDIAIGWADKCQRLQAEFDAYQSERSLERGQALDKISSLSRQLADVKEAFDAVREKLG